MQIWVGFQDNASDALPRERSWRLDGPRSRYGRV